MIDLTPEQEEEIRAKRAMVREHMPEIVPFLKDMTDLGMIQGWRCIRRVRLLTDPEWPPEHAVCAVRTGREFTEEIKREKP